VWTFSRAGSEDCRRVVRTDRDCYVVRSIGSRRAEDFGIAVSNPPYLVTQQRGGIGASSQCVGEVSTYEVRRAGRRLAFRKAGGCRAGQADWVVDEQLTAMP
jgi:hypothetical protein